MNLKRIAWPFHKYNKIQSFEMLEVSSLIKKEFIKETLQGTIISYMETAKQ